MALLLLLVDTPVQDVLLFHWPGERSTNDSTTSDPNAAPPRLPRQAPRNKRSALAGNFAGCGSMDGKTTRYCRRIGARRGLEVRDNDVEHYRGTWSGYGSWNIAEWATKLRNSTFQVVLERNPGTPIQNVFVHVVDVLITWICRQDTSTLHRDVLVHTLIEMRDLWSTTQLARLNSSVV
ncbi:hypothetical protein H257_12065 [Aphanomyces astaci]|uniref:Uncharacterized protein n=1 Tax=Aphanomyces astaci TaxID=112090 RepID=W4FZX7_APHAT|nr:hypothetical protein H257_12065 [Aphanomyces astaci]ETV73027.1 hypothetical protein H257_12065 [Aphanomyces astaci]|eukprot:XP_009837476.1 hypothetical protein H257_12065 [Aphanomyces astaci]